MSEDVWVKAWEEIRRFHLFQLLDMAREDREFREHCLRSFQEQHERDLAGSMGEVPETR